MPQTYNYHIYHITGPHLATVQAESDQGFWALIESGIPEINGYTFLQVFTDNPESTYPNFSERLPIYPEPPKKS